MNQQNILPFETASSEQVSETTPLVFPTSDSFNLKSIDPNTYAVMKVDLNQTVENYKLLKNLSNPGVCGAVVKADAYGIGARAIVSTLLKQGCCDFFVAYLDEALQIKPYLPAYARIFILNGYFPSLEREFWHHNFIPVLHNTEQLERFQTFCNNTHITHPFALHIDTGMRRTGLSCAEVRALHEKGTFKTLRPLMIMSHLSSAEQKHLNANSEEKQRFDEVATYFPCSIKSVANSSGIFLGDNFTYDLTRPGLALHGLNPTTGDNPMHSVISLYGRILQIQDLKKSDFIGYNRTYQTNTPSKIATISAGYADGIPWRLSNQSYVMVNGQKAPIVGRVSMDLITVDITNINNVELYDFAELLHREQTLDHWATTSGQLVYELLLSIGPRFKRFYVKDAT